MRRQVVGAIPELLGIEAQIRSFDRFMKNKEKVFSTIECRRDSLESYSNVMVRKEQGFVTQLEQGNVLLLEVQLAWRAAWWNLFWKGWGPVRP